MDLEKEFARSAQRLKRNLDADVQAAQRRINELTLMEWEEVWAGVREHPQKEALKRVSDGFAGLGAAFRQLVEIAAAAIEGITRGYTWQEGKDDA